MGKPVQLRLRQVKSDSTRASAAAGIAETTNAIARQFQTTFNEISTVNFELFQKLGIGANGGSMKLRKGSDLILPAMAATAAGYKKAEPESKPPAPAPAPAPELESGPVAAPAPAPAPGANT